MNPTAQKEFDTALGGLTPQERSAYTKANPNVNVGGQSLSFNEPTNAYNPVETTVSSDRIADVKPMNVRPTPTSTTAAGFGAEISSLSNAEIAEQDKQDKLLADQQAEATTAKASLDTKKKGVLDFLGLRKSESELTDEAYGKENDLGTTVDETGRKLRNVNNQINAIDIRQNEQLKELEGTFQGTTQGLVDARNAIIRNNTSAKADLYIEKLMAQGDYDTAKSIADRKVDVQMEQDRLELEKLMFDYEDNKDQYTKAEQRAFELAAEDRKRQLDEESDLRKEAEKAKIDLNRIKTEAALKGTKDEEPLDILDVQRYNELYPDAGVAPGDTETEANLKVTASNTPEARTRNLIIAAQANGNDYKTVIKEINNDPTITDKALAIKIADEVFGVFQLSEEQEKVRKGLGISKEQFKKILPGLIPGQGLPTTTKIASEYTIDKTGKLIKKVKSVGVGNIIDQMESFLFTE